jgi:hypothetical protein
MFAWSQDAATAHACCQHLMNFANRMGLSLSSVGTRSGVEWMRGPCACPPRALTNLLYGTPAKRTRTRTSTRPLPSPHLPLVPTGRRWVFLGIILFVCQHSSGRGRYYPILVGKYTSAFSKHIKTMAQVTPGHRFASCYLIGILSALSLTFGAYLSQWW